MRSLWKMMAVRWLGGQASTALTAETAPLDGLLGGETAAPAFLVRRAAEVSHHAMMSHAQAGMQAEAVIAAVVDGCEE
jgi:hypothetical protein